MTDKQKNEIQAIFEDCTKNFLTQVSAEAGVARPTCYRYMRKDFRSIRAYRKQIQNLRVQSAEKNASILAEPYVK